MFVTFDRAMLLTLLVVLYGTLVRSQAPGDAHPSCTMQSVPEDVVMLLDSAWYRSLLPSNVYDSAGWTQTPAGSWKGSGNLCFRTMKSCNSESESENWLVTQYISRTADVTYPLKITVDLEGDATSNDAIEVHYYPSNGPIESGAQLNASNYVPIGNVSFDTRSSREVVTFFLDSQFDRFYVAIVEENSCFTLRRLRVWYSLCPAASDGLVVYPATPVGESAIDVLYSCKDNSVIDGPSLTVTCNPNGTYSGFPICACIGGYIESGEACHACAAGTYAFFGEPSCSPCPANSTSASAAAFCPCIEDHFRSNPFNFSLPCEDTCLDYTSNLVVQGNYSRPEQEVTYGLLEVCVNGAFLQVCSDVDVILSLAGLACIALDYESADVVQFDDHDGTSVPVITDVICLVPSQLLGCSIVTGSSCTSGKVMQLHCVRAIPTDPPTISPNATTPSDTTPTTAGPCIDTTANLDIQGRNFNPGEVVTYGILEVCIGGSFLPVCSDIGLDSTTANFACIALGYESADQILFDAHNATSTPVITSLTCPFPGVPVGCTYNIDSSCPSNTVVQLHCLITIPTDPPTTPVPTATRPTISGTTTPSITTPTPPVPCTEPSANLDIQGGFSNQGQEVTYGLLEVCVGGSFIQVCSDISLDSATADFTCTVLGYESADQIVFEDHDGTSTPVAISLVCPIPGVPAGCTYITGASCPSGQVIQLHCLTTTPTTAPPVTTTPTTPSTTTPSDITPTTVGPCIEAVPNLDIQGGSSNQGQEVTYGLLEICVNGSFLQVCSDVGINLAVADFACIYLGYEGVDQILFEDYDGTSTPVVTSLSCPIPSVPVGCTYNTGPSCSSGEVVQLHCVETTPTTTEPVPSTTTPPVAPTPMPSVTPSPPEPCTDENIASLVVQGQYSSQGNEVTYGILVVCIDGSLAPMCSEVPINPQTADFACASFGYEGYEKLEFQDHDGTSTPVVTSLSCPPFPFEPGSCTYSTGDSCAAGKVVELHCYRAPPTTDPPTTMVTTIPTTDMPTASPTPPSPCLFPCVNGGTCVGETCVCAPKYTGSFCEFSTDGPVPVNCLAVPCQNGGTCTMGKCTCTEEYAGTFCTLTASDPTVCVFPCQNGGTCVNRNCVCPAEFTGEFCSMSVATPTTTPPTTTPPTTDPPTTTPTTPELPPTYPLLEVIGPFIAWSPPARHDGEILRYVVKITSSTGAYVIVQKNKMDVYHMLEREDVPSDLGRSTLIGIQVSAVTTEGVGDWSAEEFIPVTVLTISDVIPHLLDPEPKITFINDSPVVTGNDVEIHLATNHDVSSLKCKLDAPDPNDLGDDGDYHDCSSKMITYTNLPTAQLTFYALAEVQSSGQVITLKRSFRAENNLECSVHLINDGLTVDGNDAVVEFAFTGDHTRCSLDGEEFYDCSSPLTLTDLDSGGHSLKITSQPCPKPLRYPIKLEFDIP